MLEDIRYGFRSLHRHPILTLFAILSLALGIGANTSIFSLLDQVVLRLLPGRDPQRLVILNSKVQRNGFSTSDNNETVWPYPMYKELRDRNKTFSGVAARASAPVSFGYGNESERASAELVSGNFFEVLGVGAALGRTLAADDDKSIGAHPVVVLTYGYFKRRFGASPAVLNQVVHINGHAMTVVGVLAPDFRGLVTGSNPDVMIPIAMKREVTPTWDGLNEPNVQWLNIVARLAPGLSAQQAEAGMAPLYRLLQEEALAKSGRSSERFRKQFLNAKLTLHDGAQGINNLRRSWQTALFILMAMVAFVLLIACANIANLLLVKAAGRRKEIALRFALGANRGRVIRMLLVESLILASGGAILGLAVADWTTAALLKIAGEDSALTPQLNWKVVAFTLALTLITGILFGLFPAFRAVRDDWNSTLQEVGAAVRSGGGQTRFRKVLVGAQMALCTVLLVASGLFATNLYRLLRIDPGFRTDSIIQFRVAPKLSGYDNTHSIQFYRRLQDGLAQIPGADSVSMAGMAVLSNSNRSANVTVEGYKAKEDENTDCGQNPVAPGYFRTLGIPLIAGREFTEHDDTTSPKAVIVNESFVRHFVGDANPLGRHMTFGAGNVKLDREIVGVVRDSKHSNLLSAIPRMVYVPFPQDEGMSSLTFYVRTSRDVNAIGGQVRSMVRELDGNIPIYQLMSMKAQLEQSVTSERLLALLSNAFGLLATLLASIGLYGVISHGVASRTGEIGIRLALGAQRGDVLGLIMREVSIMSFSGIVVGGILSLWLGRYIKSQLHEMTAEDPLIVAAAATLLAIVALLAGWIPARRASRIDPLTALRHE